MFYRGAAVLATMSLLAPLSASATPARAQVERPYVVTAEVGPAFGFGFPTLIRSSVAAGRRLADRVDVALATRIGKSSDALTVEPGARFALLVHLPLSFDAHVGWWFGYAWVSKDLPNGQLRLHMFAATVSLAVTYRLSEHFELRVTPLGATGYLADAIWSITLETSAGVGVRF